MSVTPILSLRNLQRRHERARHPTRTYRTQTRRYSSIDRARFRWRATTTRRKHTEKGTKTGWNIGNASSEKAPTKIVALDLPRVLLRRRVSQQPHSPRHRLVKSHPQTLLQKQFVLIYFYVFHRWKRNCCVSHQQFPPKVAALNSSTWPKLIPVLFVLAFSIALS